MEVFPKSPGSGRMKKSVFNINTVIVFLFSVFLIFANLSRQPLERWDETTNSTVIREFVQQPNWILSLDNKPFFEKPPLWYYLTGIAVKIFTNEIQGLRVVTAASGMFIVLTVIFMINTQLSTRAANLAVLLVLSTGQLFRTNAGGFFSTHTFRSADMDALQILLLLWGVHFFLFGTEKHRDYVTSGICFGLAVLTKGPVAFFVLGITSLFVLFTKPSDSYRKTLIACCTCVIVTLPWYLFMTLTFGSSFISDHIGYHLFQRASHALEGHNQPWWFYIKILVDPQVSSTGGIFTILLPYMISRWKTMPHIVKFSTILSLTYIGVLSLVRTKLAWYILPAYPFLCISTSWSVIEIINRIRKPIWLRYGFAGSVGALIVYGLYVNSIAVL